MIDLTMTGLNVDQVSVRLGPGRTGEAAWSGSKNTRFSGKVLESLRGEVEIYAGAGPAGPALWAKNAAVGGNPWILYVTAAGIGSFDGAHADHTPVGWVTPRASQISMTTLNGLTVLNAPPNPPYHVIEGGGVATALPDWPANTYCHTLTGYRYYLVAGAIFGPSGTGESTVMWSDAAEPGALPLSWTPAATNDAGDLSLSDLPDPILAAEALGDVVVFYKFSGVYALAFVGGQAVMGRRVMFTKIAGVLNGRSVVGLERQQVVAVPGDLLVHDGAQVRSLLEGRFKDYFGARVQADMWEGVRLAHDVSRGEVWCAYPMSAGGPLAEALVWSIADDELTVRELPASYDIFYTVLIGARRTWAQQTFAWLTAGGREWSDVSHGFDATAILACLETISASSLFMQLDSSDGTSTRTVYAERVGIGVSPFGRRKLFTRLRPRIEGEVGSAVAIQVGAHDEVGAPVNWGTARTFTVGTDQSVAAMVAGRYAAARFVGADRWRIEGFQLEYEPMGRF